MKKTGIIRRIDELGRIVIPKEIRKSLRINNGENIEIYLEEDKIILKKYSIIKNISDFAQQLVDVVYSYVKKSILICDNSTFIAVSNNIKKEYINHEISNSIIDFIKRREKIIEKYNKPIFVIPNEEINTCYVLNSIISNGDVIGLVIILDEKIGQEEFEISNIISDFIGKYLEL